jgi:hypothetical protein
MIHDRTGEFYQKYADFDIKSIRTSVKSADMNSIAERVIRSIRNEALDNFIILGQNQLNKILTEYVNFYNSRRPHQSLEQDSPKGYKASRSGTIKFRPVHFRFAQDPKASRSGTIKFRPVHFRFAQDPAPKPPIRWSDVRLFPGRGGADLIFP